MVNKKKMQTLNEMFLNSSRHTEHQSILNSNAQNAEIQSTNIISSVGLNSNPALNHHTHHNLHQQQQHHHHHSNLSDINHVKQLSLDIGNLFSNTDYCDIKLIVDGVEFKAHKILLAARSEYFRALLFSGMRESNSDVIHLNETKPNAFRLLLQYIYTGKINLRNEKEDSLIDLLGLVHQYGFIDLQKSISDYLESILDIKNVCSIYDISSLYELKSLKETCSRFIDKNCFVLIKQNMLLHLSCESLASILSRDSFSAPEIEIFNIVKDWHEINKSDHREELVSKIRLPLMKLDELLNQVRESNLIDPDAILDALKLKHESFDMSLKYRGVLHPNENVATSRYQAIVIKGEFKSALLDGDVNNYDFDRGFTYHPIDDSNNSHQHSIVVKLGTPTIFNQVKLLLWDKDVRSYSYFVEVSMNEKDWVRVIDYSDYLCRSWQNLYFKSVVARFVKVVGVRNTANRIFHLVSLEVRYTLDRYDILNQLIAPHYNVASINQSAFVLEGVSRTRNALINGEFKNYDWDSGYTCHQLGSGSICIQLAQPFIIGSMRLLLWDCDNRSYSYCIETSIDQSNWSMVSDKRNEACKSWQIIVFQPRPVSFVRITGTHNTANEVFHCVHFECPCDTDILNRFLEHQTVNQVVNKPIQMALEQESDSDVSLLNATTDTTLNMSNVNLGDNQNNTNIQDNPPSVQGEANDNN